MSYSKQRRRRLEDLKYIVRNIQSRGERKWRRSESREGESAPKNWRAEVPVESRVIVSPSSRAGQRSVEASALYSASHVALKQINPSYNK